MIKKTDALLVNYAVFLGLIFFQALVLIQYQVNYHYFVNLLGIFLFFFLVRSEIKKVSTIAFRRLGLPSFVHVFFVSVCAAILGWHFLYSLNLGYIDGIANSSPLYTYLAVVTSFLIFNSPKSTGFFSFFLLLFLIVACLLAGRRMIFLIFLPCFLIFFKVSRVRVYLGFIALLIILVLVQAHRIGVSVQNDGGMISVAYNAFDTYHSALALSKFHLSSCGGGAAGSISFAAHHLGIGYQPSYYLDKYECSVSYGIDLKGGGWIAHHFQWFIGKMYAPFMFLYIFLTVKSVNLIPKDWRLFSILILLMSSFRMFFYSPNAGLKTLLFIAVFASLLMLLPRKKKRNGSRQTS